MSTERIIFTDVDDKDVEVEHVIPSKFEVCGGCDGKGSHVHRAIDEDGLSREDFDRDPDFEEEYFAGVYDVSCEDCHGKRVALVPDWNAKWPEGLKERYEEYLEAEAYNVAERAAERRMGA